MTIDHGEWGLSVTLAGPHLAEDGHWGGPVTMSPGYDRAIRIAVRSDRRLFREALATCLAARPEYQVVGHAADLDDLFVLCELRRPDVVLVDVGTGPGTGDRTLGRLRDCVARCRVIVVYERLTPAELAALWRLGVDTLVPCSHGLDALLVVLARYRDDGHRTPARPAPDDGLSEREQEIITLVSAGHTVGRIAELLDISAAMVANTKRRIYHKLDVASQSQAVARAATLGLVGRPPVRHAVTGVTAGATTVLLRGGTAWPRQQVAAALLAGGVPFMMAGSADLPEAAPGDYPESVLVVLIDPTPEDWPAGRDAGTPVTLVCTDPPRRVEVIQALLRGAVAVVTVDRVAADLVPALTLATQGYLAVEAVAAGALLDAVRTPTVALSGLPELTSRETDILRSIADGHTVRQTARALGIAEKTVENTQARLFRKLGARNRAGTLAAAHAFGLLEPVASRPGTGGGSTPAGAAS